MSILLPFLLAAAAAPAQDMVGISWTGDVYSIDSNTGAGAFVGTSGYSSVNSMAKSPAGVLYAIAGYGVPGSLITVDPVTGAGTYVATTSLNSVRGMAFDAAGVLYAVNDSSGTGFGIDDLYTVDLVTGTATFIGSTGYYGIQGVAHANGVLYGWELGSGSGVGAGLVTISKTTGAATDVNGSIGNNGSIQTLCATAGGALYGAQNSVYSIDTVTGSATLIGGSGISDLRGVEFTGGGGSGPTLAKTGSCPGPVTLTVTGASANRPVAILHGTPGTFTYGGTPCNGITLDLASPTVGAIVSANGSGVAALSFNSPAGACGRTVQAVDVDTCTKTNTITL